MPLDMLGKTLLIFVKIHVLSISSSRIPQTAQDATCSVEDALMSSITVQNARGVEFIDPSYLIRLAI